jgi:hypothetical protein
MAGLLSTKQKREVRGPDSPLGCFVSGPQRTWRDPGEGVGAYSAAKAS